MTTMKRYKTHKVMVGNVAVGGGAPVVVQSMTSTDTADIKATAAQAIELARAGSEIVRITVNNNNAAKAVPYIRDTMWKEGVYVPLVGCMHYNGHELLNKYPACAEALDKYRINPGNVGFGEKRDKQFEQIISIALKYNQNAEGDIDDDVSTANPDRSSAASIPKQSFKKRKKAIRIGVNWGSLDKALSKKLMDENAKLACPKPSQEVLREALVLSALTSADQAVKLGLSPNQIIISCKVSRVQDVVAVHRELARRCKYPLHVGLTEAGMGMKGIVATTAALSILLQEGIGDTIRASLTPHSSEARTNEVKACWHILQELGLRPYAAQVTACPSCGRTKSTYFQELAGQVTDYLDSKMAVWKPQCPGVESMIVAVMGCIVNGPGESKHANIGISLPGTGERAVAAVDADGQKYCTLHGDNILEEFIEIIENYVKNKYGRKVEAA